MHITVLRDQSEVALWRIQINSVTVDFGDSSKR